jgi:hypothetical protein
LKGWLVGDFPYKPKHFVEMNYKCKIHKDSRELYEEHNSPYRHKKHNMTKVMIRIDLLEIHSYY